MRLLRAGFALLLAGSLVAGAWGQVPALDRRYFGFHAHRLAKMGAWPSVAFGSWRLWDAYVSWPHLEPEPDRWTFQILDRYVALAREHDVEILLPLGLSPTWASARPAEESAYAKPGWAAEPRELVSWERYVRTVVTRYAGSIRYYEIWNEPNLKRFFSGDVQTMLRLTCSAARIIREVDPNARLVSPAATDRDAGVAWLGRFLDAGGAKCVDVIGFHFYTLAHEDPETLPRLIQAVRRLAAAHGGLPVWNTETGWYFANARVPPRTRYRVREPQEAAAFVMRALVLAAAEGVERFFWYAWDNPTMGGLIEPDSGEPKPAAHSLAVTIRWLVGSRVGPCSGRADGVWLCRLEHAGRGRAWLAWATATRPRWRLPAEVVARAYWTVDGGGMIGPERSVDLGPLPVLLGEGSNPW